MAVDEWSALARTGGPRLSRMFFDLDHFKSINDLHGHAAGDECLRAFATHLRQAFPEPGALVARLGGEEFGALVRDDVLQDVAVRADRFRGEFAGMVLACNPDEIRSSVSIGVVGFDPAQHADGDALYQAADRALYRAKAAGRNTVVVVEPD